MADNVKLPEGAVFLDEQEVRPPEGLTFLDEVPTGSNVDIKRTKRSLINSDFGDREGEARVAVGAYMAHQLKIPFRGTNDYAGIADAYFGGKGIVPATQAAKKLKNMLEVQEQPDALDELDAIDNEEQKLEKAADIATPSLGTRLYGWFIGGDTSPHRTDPRTLTNRPDLKKKLLLDARIKALQGSRKRRLAFHQSILSDNAKRFAEATMLTEKGNIMAFKQLSPKDQRFFYGYLRELEPEIDERYSTEFVQALDNASKRTAHAFKEFGEVATDTIAGRQSPFQIYTFIKNKYKDEKINGEPIFTSDGQFTSDSMRDTIASDMQQRFSKKNFALKQISQSLQGTGETPSLVQDLEALPDEDVNVIPDLFEQGRQEFETRAHDRSVFNSTMERFKESGFLHDNSLKATEMLIDMGLVMSTSAVTFGSGGIAYSAARFQGEAAQDLIFNHGVSNADANVISWIAAAPYAAVERIQVAQLSKGARGFLEGWKTGGKKALMSALAKHGVNYASEVGEETVQKLFEQSAKLYAMEYANATGVDFDELMKEVGTEFIESAKTMPFLTAPGASLDLTKAAKGALFKVDSAKEELARIDAEKVEVVKVDDIDTVSEEVKDEYELVKTDDEKIAVLEDSGIENAEQVHEQIQEETAFEEEVKAKVEQQAPAIEAEEKRFDDLRIAMENEGVTSKQVKQLSDTLDPKNVGQYVDEVIEVKDGIKDTSRVFNHEVFHHMVKAGHITESDWDAFRVATAKPEYKNLNLRYSSFEGDAKVEEVMADAWATFTPEERTVWKKVFDYIKGFFAVKTEKEVFQRLDEYLQSSAKQGRAKGLTGDFNVEGDTTPADGVKFARRDLFPSNLVGSNRGSFAEGLRFKNPIKLDDGATISGITPEGLNVFGRDKNGVEYTQKVFDALKHLPGNLTPTAEALMEFAFSSKELDTKFAQGEQVSPDVREDAARVYALAKAEGSRNLEGIAKDLSEQTGSDARDIAAIGESLYEDSISNLEEGATRLQKRTAIRTRSIERAARTELRAAQKAGVQLAKEGTKAKERIAKDKDKAKRAELKHKTPASDEQIASINMLPIILANDAQKLIDQVESVSNEVIIEREVKDKKVKDSIYKRTLAHTLWQAVRQLPYDRTRSAVGSELNKMRLDKTSVAEVNEMARDIVKRLNRVQELAREENLVKKIGELFKTEVGKKPSDKTLKIDRNIDAGTHTQLSIAKEIWKKTEEKVNAISKRIDTFLSGTPSNTFDSNMDEGLLIDIETFMPAIKREAFNELNSLQKIQYAKFMLDRWGAIAKKGNTVLAQALEDLENEIEVAKRDQLDAMKEQAKDSKIGVGWFRLGTGNKSGKKSIIRVSPTFQNIRQRIEELGNFSTKRGQTAMSKLVDKLEFQESNTKFDTLQRQWGARIGDIIKDAYSAKFLDRAVRRLNAKRQEYAKFHPKGDAMSKAQLMQILATWMQSDYKGNLRATSITQDVINEIEKVMTDGDWVFLDGLGQLYADIGVELDKISNDIWGTNVSNSDPFYMPVVTDITQEWNGTEMRVTPLAPPSLNKRIPSNREMDLEVGITEMLDSRLAQSAHFIAYAKSHVLAKSVFTDKESIDKLTRTYGNDIWKGLQNHLTDIYSNGGSDAFRSKWLQRTLNVMTMRALSGNLKLPFTQITSLPSYALKYRSWNLVKMLTMSATDPKAYGAAMAQIASSEEFKNRLQLGGTEFMQQALKERFGVSSFDAIPSDKLRDAGKFTADLIKKMYKYGMMTNKVGDLVPILLVGPSILTEELRNTGDMEAAMTNTWEVIQDTQQSYAVKNRSALSRRGNVLGKLLSAFTTTPGQYLAFESAAFRTMTAKVQKDGFVNAIKSREFAALADTVFVNHVLLPGMFYTVSQTISNLMRGDDWDEDDTNGLIIAMMTGPFSAWMVFAGLTKDFLNEAMDGRANVWGGLLPIDSFRRDAKLLGEVVKHVAEGDVDEAIESAWKEFKNFVTPARQISQTIENN